MTYLERCFNKYYVKNLELRTKKDLEIIEKSGLPRFATYDGDLFSFGQCTKAMTSQILHKTLVLQIEGHLGILAFFE